MEKRNLLNTKTILRLCIGFLLGFALLSTHHSFSIQPKRRDISGVVFSSAAPEVCISLQNPIANPRWTEWDVSVWVPVELALDDSLCDSVAADYLLQDLTFPVALKLPNSVVAVDIPEPEPLPALLYGLFLVAFGLVGFFVAAPATTGPLLQHRLDSSHGSRPP
jgi:hypothetical protein